MQPRRAGRRGAEDADAVAATVFHIRVRVDSGDGMQGLVDIADEMQEISERSEALRSARSRRAQLPRELVDLVHHAIRRRSLASQAAQRRMVEASLVEIVLPKLRIDEMTLRDQVQRHLSPISK